jgi:hypothetical protein
MTWRWGFSYVCTKFHGSTLPMTTIFIYFTHEKCRSHQSFLHTVLTNLSSMVHFEKLIVIQLVSKYITVIVSPCHWCLPQIQHPSTLFLRVYKGQSESMNIWWISASSTFYSKQLFSSKKKKKKESKRENNNLLFHILTL